MAFDALYGTENDADGGYRRINASSLQDAKEVLKSQIEKEGNHGHYVLHAIQETGPSFTARRGLETGREA